MKTAIFDLDGTVVSNEDAYGQAFAEVLRKFGAKHVSYYPYIGGIGVEENWFILKKEYKLDPDLPVKELSLQTQKAYLERINEIKIKPGFDDFAEKVREKGIKTALATSNDSRITDLVLVKLKIKSLFDVIVTADMVANKKPDPEIFILASTKAAVEPFECTVFEDSVAGIEAAFKASMKVVGIWRNSLHKSELKKAGASLLVNDFTDSRLELLTL
jgi:beta-phosphoglucomutase